MAQHLGLLHVILVWCGPCGGVMVQSSNSRVTNRDRHVTVSIFGRNDSGK